MRLRIVAFCLSALSLLWATQNAHAGAIRSAGKGLGKGSVLVAHGTADAAGAAAGAAASAGKATGGVVGAGTVGVVKGAAATPGLAWRGTKAGAKRVFKALW